MSNYKYLDDNGLIYYHSKIKALLNGKVDTETGKGLSSNDYTSTEKTKLSGIASGAEVNQNAFTTIKTGTYTSVVAASKTDTLELAAGTDISVGTDMANKKITISCAKSIPDATSDLTNDSGFITSSALSGYQPTSGRVTSISSSSTDQQYPTAKCVYDEIQDAIGSVTGLNFEIVQALPASGTAGTIYLLSNGGTAPDVYDEYVWIASSSSFEKIGSTDVDLTGYVQASEMVTITNAEIDNIVSPSQS